MTASLMMPAAPGAQVFQSDLFGELQISEARLIEFPEGLLGFPECRQWIALDGPVNGTAWLQSAEYSGLAFFCIEPFVVFPEYTLDVPAAVVEQLGATHQDKLFVLSLVTLANRGRTATANLQGPVLMNLRERTGLQIVTSDSEWSIRQPLPPQVLRWER
jgi:flagellar assembly factor FliW